MLPGDGYGLEALARTLTYVPALVVLGAVGYQWRYGTEGSRSDLVRRRALTVAVVLVVAIGFRAVAHTLEAFGEDAYSWESLRTVVFESRWGDRWRWQLAAAAAMVATLLVSLKAPETGFELNAVAAAALCVSLPMTGHAMVEGASGIAIQSFHVAGAGIWLGTLVWLAAMHRDDPNPAAFQRFTLIASIGAALVVTTGALVALQRLSTASDLWQSSYGRALLLKVALVAGVGACGALNWRRYRGSQPSGGRAWIWSELAVALTVLIATGSLSETGPP